MVLPIHFEEKKIVLEKDLVENVKLIGERIERQLRKGKSYLIIVRSWKSSLAWRMYKWKKLMKFGYFKVSRKIDEQAYKFELQDDLLLHYKFHPPDCIQALGQVSFKRGRMM